MNLVFAIVSCVTAIVLWYYFRQSITSITDNVIQIDENADVEKLAQQILEKLKAVFMVIEIVTNIAFVVLSVIVYRQKMVNIKFIKWNAIFQILAVPVGTVVGVITLVWLKTTAQPNQSVKPSP